MEVQPDGETYRQHLLHSAAKGRTHPELVADSRRPTLYYLWTWLEEIGFIASVGMGAFPLSYAEIEAWSNLTGRKLIPAEVAAMRKASEKYAAFINRPRAAKTPEPRE
jgi:hypothetical protein